MTTAEQLAVAVLRGDESAARGLVDCLLESWQGAARTVKPVRLTTDTVGLRMIVYVKEDHVIGNASELHRRCLKWLEGRGRVLMLRGADRVEVYQLPEGT